MKSSQSETRKEGIAGPDKKSLAGLGLIILAAVYFYVLAGKIDENPIPGQLGPAFWPRAMLILLIASCGLKIIEVFRGGAKGVADVIGSGPLLEVNRLKLWVMIAMVLGVVYFLEVLGFALANFIFLLLFMRIAGLRRIPPLVLISLLGTVALLYLFVKVVYLPLPKGQFFFDDLTILLYRFLRII